MARVPSGKLLTASWLSVAKAPAGSTWRVVAFMASNQDTSAAPFSLQVLDFDANPSNTAYTIFNAAPIAPGGNIWVPGDWPLNPQDDLQAKSDGANKITVYVVVDDGT